MKKKIASLLGSKHATIIQKNQQSILKGGSNGVEDHVGHKVTVAGGG